MSNKLDYQQKIDLVNYMENHLYVAKCQVTKLGPNGKKTYDKIFKLLAPKLNDAGNFTYTFNEWQKLWNELRLEARKKLNEYLKAMGKTGNKNVNVPEPDMVDLRICAIFGKHGLGQHIGSEIGLTVGPNNLNVAKPLHLETNQMKIFYRVLKDYPEVILNPIFPHDIWERASEASKDNGFYKTSEEWFWFWKNAKENTEKQLLMMELTPALELTYEELFISEIIKEAESSCDLMQPQESSKVALCVSQYPKIQYSRRKRLSTQQKHNVNRKQKLVDLLVKEQNKSTNVFLQNMKDGFSSLTGKVNQALSAYKLYKKQK